MEIDMGTESVSALVCAARMIDAVVVVVCDAVDSSSCSYDDVVRTKTKRMTTTSRLWLVSADEAATHDEDYEDDENEEEKDEQQTDELLQWQWRLKKTPMNKSTTTRLTMTSVVTCCSS